MDTSSNEIAQGRDPDPEHIRLYYYKLDSAPIGNVQVKMLIRSNQSFSISSSPILNDIQRLFQINFGSNSDLSLTEINPLFPHNVLRSSIPGICDVGDLIVNVNDKDIRDGQFRKVFGKVDGGRLLSVDVLKVDPSSNFLKPNFQVTKNCSFDSMYFK